MAAFAATTVTPPVVAVGGAVTIVDDASVFPSGIVSGGTPGGTPARVQVLLGGTATGTVTTCAATMPVAGTTNVAATTVNSSASNSSVTFTSPGTATADTNGKAKRYIACVYGPTGTDTRIGPATGYPYYVVGSVPVVTPPGGVSGGGGSITVNSASAVFTGATNVGALFTTDQCPQTYGSPAAGTGATATKLSDNSVSLTVPSGVTASSTAVRTTSYSLCLYNNNTSAGTLVTAASYLASPLTLSQGAGSYAGGNALNINSSTAFLAGIDTPGVSFSNVACPAKYNAPDASPDNLVFVNSNNVRKVGTTNTRLAVTVPQLLASAPASAATWYVCVYNGTANASSDLIGSSAYGVTTVQTATAISPRAGSALGGARIVVAGTAFPTTQGAISATLGGTPLLDIKPLTSTAFEATTPAHTPANNVALVVTTAAGSTTLPSAYSFTAALNVTPNTAPNTRTIDVIVNGIGFQSASFNQGGAVTGSHFYLVDGVYSGNEGTASSGTRANAPVADCSNVLVMTDTEALCTLDLRQRLNAAGTTALAPAAPGTGIAAANGLATATSTTVAAVQGSRILRAAATAFTNDMIGLVLFEQVPDKLPVGTTITGVLSPTLAVISANAVGSGNLTAALLPPAAKQVTITSTNGSANITGPAGTFASTDDDAFIVGPGIAPGATIDSYTSPTAVTLSGNATTGNGAGTGTAFIIPASAKVPVPEGAYNMTFVSNGALNAVSSDPNYVQSQVSSGSTFTVSAF
ncbi:IPT/TIG domain-containing protein [Actinoplanes sp. URMC 104]|uniref:IPT/TIG domain-containing protein n=1 Tax=Actinoplanes sp. URMC 104 TaxID=3423409 RepID=UPI003F1DE853